MAVALGFRLLALQFDHYSTWAKSPSVRSGDPFVAKMYLEIAPAPEISPSSHLRSGSLHLDFEASSDDKTSGSTSAPAKLAARRGKVRDCQDHD